MLSSRLSTAMGLSRSRRWLAACLVLAVGWSGGPAVFAAPPADPAAGPAALSLLKQAQGLAHGGRSEEAAAILERAIRMEPRNPWLWHRLAVLRLQEERHALAIELAKKSNVLARGNRRLAAGNRLLVAKARAGLRDGAGAAKAGARAQGSLRQAGP